MTLTCLTTTGAGDADEDVTGLAMVGTITVVVPVSRLIWRFGWAATVDVAVAAADTARRMLIAVTAVEVGIIRTVGRPLLVDGEPALPPDTAIWTCCGDCCC